MNATESEPSALQPPDHRRLTDLLREQVQARPDATAVVYQDAQLSYRQLDDAATGLAQHLRRLGVSADSCVGLYAEPSLELMTAAWGILHAGGAYLPLSPEYPEERLRFMIEHSRASVVVAQEHLAERLADLAPHGTLVVTLDPGLHAADNGAATVPGMPDAPAAVDAQAVAGAQSVADAPADDGVAGPPVDLAEGVGPDDLAYVIYTSGSTGKPKGVMIEHRAIVNQMRWMGEAQGLGPGRRVLQKTPMSFDAAQWEILAPACGATVVMGRPGVYRDPEALIETVLAHEVTTLQCVPTLLQALLDTERLAGCSSLTQVFSGGEALSRRLAVQFTTELADCDLINLYGPTECTINSSAHQVDPATVGDGPQSVPIGVPVRGTQYRILGPNGLPVAPGEIGELQIGGVQLARGYLHRPDLTEERFVTDPLHPRPHHPDARFYRTGDLAYWNSDGTVQFAGRADNQVKLRGYRVELDEIALTIEEHDWVRKAAVIVKDDPRTGFQNLLAAVELNPREALLMDQGNQSEHHRSKSSKVQVKAQLSNPGVREEDDLIGRPAVELPGAEATARQRRTVFARKTYRFYEGGPVSRDDVLRLLGGQAQGSSPTEVSQLSRDRLGELLRWFGQYQSEERLLPKYGYASPGALYATQLYLELGGVAGLDAGLYYYHPVQHRLVLIAAADGAPTDGPARFKVHFVGRRRAIEPVYRTNVQEVLEIEAGHMVGLFEAVLPDYGLDITPDAWTPSLRGRLGCAEDDVYLGSFALVPFAGPRPDDASDLYVQSRPAMIAELPAGQYRYHEGELERISDELIMKKHVIAINQQVYERSSLGISIVSRAREPWLQYIELGRRLQRLQMNDVGLGFMASGYSSRGGQDLPSARRIAGILAARGEDAPVSYFCVGGRISAEQQASQGMREDAVHMRGPTEIIKDDLANFLPDYMLPNQVVVVDRLPLSANGKVDTKTLAASDALNRALASRPFVAPRTPTEELLVELWGRALKYEDVSVRDDFFEGGGNSLIAVALINRINREFCCSLPLQVLFECPTLEELALRIDAGASRQSSRLVRLQDAGARNPVFCWPGLGGYTMNLRALAGRIGIDRPFYGVQAHGINEGETPYATIAEMAAADIRAIRKLQPEGPYTLWGYSFGARVAFETAHQLEQAGQRVENLFLIAPGSPRIGPHDDALHGLAEEGCHRAYVTLLFSVFAAGIEGPMLTECLEVIRSEEAFIAFIGEKFPGLDSDLTRRIIRVVRQTFEFEYSFRELLERTIEAPVTIFKARGDDYSFLEGSSGYSAQPPHVVDLDADHYSLLKRPDLDELVRMIRRQSERGFATAAAGAGARS
ncbi:amino acid adenylation domain-containing protein [Streptacidiphilus sp. N1-3]|uniref:Amino acid adenylation domain-containing protein n=1 Tax=Streptacidiphilus alkalitolerans TaxID=3342712 RepID=A0ABV6WTV0_9ACTN